MDCMLCIDLLRLTDNPISNVFDFTYTVEPCGSTIFTHYPQLRPPTKRRQPVWNHEMGRGRPFSIIQWVITENMWRGIIMSPTIRAQQNGSFRSSFCWLKVQITINSLHCTWSCTCLSASHLRFLHNLQRTQSAINQNGMDYNPSEEVANSAFLFLHVRRLWFSSTRRYTFANLQKQAVLPFVLWHPVLFCFWSPLLSSFYHNEFPLRSRNQSCLIINCRSAMTCLFHFHSVVVDVAGAD